MNWAVVLVLLAAAEALGIACAVLYLKDKKTKWFWVLAVPSIMLSMIAFGMIVGYTYYG